MQQHDHDLRHQARDIQQLAESYWTARLAFWLGCPDGKQDKAQVKIAWAELKRLGAAHDAAQRRRDATDASCKSHTHAQSVLLKEAQKNFEDIMDLASGPELLSVDPVAMRSSPAPKGVYLAAATAALMTASQVDGASVFGIRPHPWVAVIFLAWAWSIYSAGRFFIDATIERESFAILKASFPERTRALSSELDEANLTLHRIPRLTESAKNWKNWSDGQLKRWSRVAERSKQNFYLEHWAPVFVVAALLATGLAFRLCAPAPSKPDESCRCTCTTSDRQVRS